MAAPTFDQTCLFSYAKRNDSEELKLFFRDLEDALGGSGSDVMRWPDRSRFRADYVEPAALTAGTIIAMCSPSYFRSRQCGREWGAFHGRVSRQYAHTPEANKLIFNIKWRPTPEDRIPPVVLEVGYPFEASSSTYYEKGLQHLMKSGGLYEADEYERFLSDLVSAIDQATRATPLDSDPEREATVSAFHTSPTQEVDLARLAFALVVEGAPPELLLDFSPDLMMSALDEHSDGVKLRGLSLAMHVQRTLSSRIDTDPDPLWLLWVQHTRQDQLERLAKALRS